MFMMVSTVYANDIYITQSGATLDLDILQDGENNTIGSSTTSSSVIGATTNFDIKQQEEKEVVEQPSPASVKPRRASKRIKRTTNKKKNCVSRYFKHTSAKYSTKPRDNNCAQEQQVLAATTTIKPSSVDNFTEGDRVQLIKDDNFKGQVGTIVRITPVQVQIKFGKYSIYRKKCNIRKLDF